MASPSVLRSATLPTRLSLKSGIPKPILKRSARPTPLPLSPSPFPFTLSFNALFTASPQSPSPHVHFPASPSLISTYSTHSPNSYDRAPISVSPNPLELPSWGDRIYSPSIGGFKLSTPPKPKSFKKLGAVDSFEDPRSPRPNASTKFAASMARGSKPRVELGKALSSYPRSPYPSAPLSSMEEIIKGSESVGDVQGNTNQSGGRQPKRRNSASAAPLAPPPRAKCKEERVSNRRNPTLNLSLSSRRPAPPFLNLSVTGAQPFILSPVQEATGNLKSTGVEEVEEDSNASGDSSRLSNAFWQSVKIEEGFESGDSNSSGFPESVSGSVESEVSMPKSLMPASMPVPPPNIMFGNSDGALWSPGLPRKPSGSTLTQTRTVSGVNQENSVKRSTFAAPSPNDPFASFPSFAAVMKETSETSRVIRPPPRAFIP